MHQSPRSGAVSELSAALNHKLNRYCLAAGAGLLALAQPAEAKIVYTKTHHVIGLHHPYKVDLTNDGTIDFLIQETQGGSMGFLINRLAAKGERGNLIEGSSRNGRGYAAALKGGAFIGRRQKFVAARSGEMMASVQQSDTVFYKYYGQWYNVTNRYLGMKFEIHGKTHYGWARLNVFFHGFTLTGTITGYAYETIANKRIIAGKTKGEDGGAAAPPSLGHLARGASVISAWRLRRTAADAR